MNARRSQSRRPAHARRIPAGPRRPAHPDAAAPPGEAAASGGALARLPAFLRLMRLDRPVGIWLLAAPTLWALWMAAGGWPSPLNLGVFLVGCVLMRSAGCVVNDFFDRDFDARVSRTRTRPLVTGEVAPREALVLLALLLAAAALLLPLLNALARWFALLALLLALTYPLAKRYTHLPQLHLGVAFGMGIPMAWAAEAGELTRVTGLLFIANVLWSLAYDTLYAMADREDDLKAGVKSTAILFGELDLLIVGCLQILTLLVLAMAGGQAGLGAAYHVALLGAAGLFAWQQYLARERQPERCLRAFRNNQWVGAIVLLGLMTSF
jgi:4-hydroxybenzoate polyprenyltransferase